MEHLLERKIRYFLKSPYRGRDGVRSTLKELQRFGRLALIGGMLRDVALFGNAGFKSDLDFVIDPYDLSEFERHMLVIGARENRFGGYALPSTKWQIDVWPLQRTWAHMNGHAQIRTVGDLREGTFFKCDAIVYDLEHKKLRTKNNYFEELEKKVLEVNLRPNPNPKGNAVRAFRYSLIKGFQWGPKLSQFVSETINNIGWEALKESEFRSFRTQYLEVIDAPELMNGLELHLSEGDEKLFNPAAFQLGIQLELPFHN